MTPNYERPSFSPTPKGRPKLLAKRDRDAGRDAIDRAERKKCRERSGGKCEVIVHVTPLGRIINSCRRRASENHHLIGGIGRRNRGRSILAAHRLDVCKRCHEDITGKVLVPLDWTQKENAATVRFLRVE